MLEFQNGNLDECYRIPNESFKSIVTSEKTLTPEFSQFVLQKNPSLSLQFYGFLTTGKIFNNEKVELSILINMKVLKI